MQLEQYLATDDRIVLPVGSTEQHAYLSLETDNIIAERLAVEAADPVGVPVFRSLLTASRTSTTSREARRCGRRRSELWCTTSSTRFTTKASAGS